MAMGTATLALLEDITLKSSVYVIQRYISITEGLHKCKITFSCRSLLLEHPTIVLQTICFLQFEFEQPYYEYLFMHECQMLHLEWANQIIFSLFLYIYTRDPQRKTF